jgi:hypothetical protein
MSCTPQLDREEEEGSVEEEGSEEEGSEEEEEEEGSEEEEEEVVGKVDPDRHSTPLGHRRCIHQWHRSSSYPPSP